MSRVVVILAVLLLFYGLVGIPNGGPRPEFVIYCLTFGFALVLLVLGIVLARLERIESALKSKEPQKSV